MNELLPKTARKFTEVTQKDLPLAELSVTPLDKMRFIDIDDIYHAPTDDARVLFDPRLNINRPDLGYRQRFAQTPLCPNRLYTYRQQYPRIIEMLMDSRCGEIFEDIELMEPYIEAIQDEVMIGFDQRYEANGLAYGRLREAVALDADSPIDGVTPIFLGREKADLIWRAMTAGASLRDTGKLLLQYPTMGSIEAVKYTRPFHPDADSHVQEHIYKGLGECIRDDTLDLEIFSGDDERVDFRYADVFKKSDRLTAEQRERRRLIIATKDTIAEMTDGDTSVELVRRRSFIAIRPEAELRGVKPQVRTVAIRDLHGDGYIKRQANLQQIGTACYWRRKKSPDEDAALELA